MNRNVVIALLAAAVVALGAVCVVQYRNALKAPPPPATRRYATSPRTPPDPTKEWIAPSRSGTTPRREAVVRRETPPPQPAPDAPDAASDNGAKPPAMLMAGLTQMLKSPAMKNMVRGQQKVAIDMQYGQLFPFLNLAPEKLDALKEMLADRQMAFMDQGLDMMSPGGSQEDREAKAAALAATKQEYDRKIADLIGPENNSLYSQFEETQPERVQVQMFKQSLSGTDTLTPEQEHELIRAMYEERQSLGTEAPGGTAANPAAPPLTEEAMQQALERMQALDDRYTQRAETVLSPAQMEQFRKSGQQQRSMQQMGLKMAAQMMGQQEK